MPALGCGGEWWMKTTKGTACCRTCGRIWRIRPPRYAFVGMSRAAKRPRHQTFMLGGVHHLWCAVHIPVNFRPAVLRDAPHFLDAWGTGP